MKKHLTKRKMLFMLSDQGSNLDSSAPKTDVLPVTPSDNGAAKIVNGLKLTNVFLKITPLICHIRYKLNTHQL